MSNRPTELDEFKKLNLSVIASAYGYQVVEKHSRRDSIKMTNGKDHIFITQRSGTYLYWNVDGVGKGTVFDFVAHERGYFQGSQIDWKRVCDELRPYLGAEHFQSIQKQHAGQYASHIASTKPRVVDYEAVAQRYNAFLPVSEPHPYLCQERAIPFEILQSDRVKNALRHCPRSGAVVFPNYGCPEGQATDERVLVGYEIKGPGGLNMFSKGGSKTLWMTAGGRGDTRIAFCESALDGLSYLVLQESQQTRVASVGGQMRPDQLEYVASAMRRMPMGSTVIAAFDNDKSGDGLCEQLEEVVGQVQRPDLAFQVDRPLTRGHDWNQVLQERAIEKGQIMRPGPSMGR